jgi:hypothetical protein
VLEHFIWCDSRLNTALDAIKIFYVISNLLVNVSDDKPERVVRCVHG